MSTNHIHRPALSLFLNFPFSDTTDKCSDIKESSKAFFLAFYFYQFIYLFLFLFIYFFPKGSDFLICRADFLVLLSGYIMTNMTR